MADKGGGGTTIASTSLPEWVQPYAQGYLNQATDVASQPYQAYNQQRVADLSPTTQTGVQGVANLAGGIPSQWAADNMLGQTLSGEGFNPYLGAMSDRIINDSSRAYQANTGAITQRFNGAGNFGGSAHMAAQDHANQDYTHAMGDSLATLYGTGYQAERANQMQAAGAANNLYGSLGQGYKDAISAGGIDSAHQQSLLDSLYGDFQSFKNYPQDQLGIMSGVVSSLLGGGGIGKNTTSTGPGADPLSQGMGYLMLANLMGFH